MNEITISEGLSEIIDYRGRTPPKSESGITLISAANIKSGSLDFSRREYISRKDYIDWTTRGFTIPGDILFTTEAPTGEVALLPKEGIYQISRRVIALRTDEGILHNLYLFYLLQSPYTKLRMLSANRGSTVPRLLKTDITEFVIEIPEVNTQREIAKTLSCLDRKIENLRKQNETLEAIAQTLFKHWFVDFEFPDENGNPYKSSGGAMVRSELGEIPEGWSVPKLGDEVETLGGGTPSTKEPDYWNDGDIPWYSPTDLTKSNSIFSLDSVKKITQLGLDKSSAKLLPAYSLLLTSRATIGEITINTEPACTNQGFITLIPNEKFTIYYLYGWLKTQIGLIKQLASGSTFPELSKSTFRNFLFINPHSKQLRAYNQVISPSFQKIENNIRQIKNLTQVRDNLLPKLMSGQIRTGS